MVNMFPVCEEGRFQANYIPVMTHVSGAIQNIKRLNKDFFVMLNRRTGKYEVHVAGQPYTTFGCELPFDELDGRAVPYIRERMGLDMIEEGRKIEEANEKLADKRIDSAYDKANYKGKNAIDWAVAHPSKQEIPKELIAE